MKQNRWLLILPALLAAALACSLGGGQNADQNTAPADTEIQPANSSPTDVPEEAATQEDTQPQNQEMLLLPDLTLPEVELTTPTEGVGVKPLFEWVPVEGASWYGLVLKNDEGKSYWAWMGAETSIYLGGVSTQPADNAAGPVLQAGMQWAVIAYDADGNLIAASLLRPISP